jgi:hypothetical protein
MKWSISYCMQQAWKPQLPRARIYLNDILDFHDAYLGSEDNIPLTNEFRMDMARLDIPVSG